MNIEKIQMKRFKVSKRALVMTLGDGWPQTDYNQEKCPDFFFRTNFVIIIPADVKSITVAIE